MFFLICVNTRFRSYLSQLLFRILRGGLLAKNCSKVTYCQKECGAPVQIKRSQTTFSLLPVSGFSNEKEDALRLGASGLVPKPFAQEELINAVERIPGLPFVREDVPLETATKTCDSDSPDNSVSPPLSEEFQEQIKTAVHEGDIETLRALARKAADSPCLRVAWEDYWRSLTAKVFSD